VIDEDLIKYGLEEDVWFHADKLSSAHIYLRMNEGDSWEAIPEELVIDCAQLTKANSIEGMLTQLLSKLAQDIHFIANREQEGQYHNHLHPMVES
jgi:hypothetical protein